MQLQLDGCRGVMEEGVQLLGGRLDVLVNNAGEPAMRHGSVSFTAKLQTASAGVPVHPCVLLTPVHTCALARLHWIFDPTSRLGMQVQESLDWPWQT